MSAATDRVMAALAELGEDVSYQEAQRWLKQQYGKDQGVSDALFYNTRKNFRAGKLKMPASKTNGNGGNDRVSDQVSGSGQSTQTQSLPEFTFDELREIAGFVRRCGGKARLAAALTALEELTV